MRPSGLQIFTRTIGGWMTLARMIRSKRASAAGLPRTTAGVRFGSATPRAAVRGVFFASRNASLLPAWGSSSTPASPSSTTIVSPEIANCATAERPDPKPGGRSRRRGLGGPAAGAAVSGASLPRPGMAKVRVMVRQHDDSPRPHGCRRTKVQLKARPQRGQPDRQSPNDRRRKTMTPRYRKAAALLAAAAALSVAAVPVAQARHGADDPPNHERVHHHRHHGRHHAEDARHGKDDPAGHDRNDDRGGDREASGANRRVGRPSGGPTRRTARLQTATAARPPAART